MCESKCMTDTSPQRSNVDRSAASVVVWSPPSVTRRGILDWNADRARRPEATFRAVSARALLQGRGQQRASVAPHLAPGAALDSCGTDLVCMFQLLQGRGVVEERQGRVAAVHDLGPAVQGALACGASG
jgi:hypothetical protein